MKIGSFGRMKKDKEGLVNYLEKEISNFKPGQMIYNYLRFILNQVNQLDEPEVLSEDWIEEHSHIVNLLGIPDTTTVAVLREDLKGLLVPKQELPVIPKFVAEYLDEKKECPISELIDSHLIYDVYDELARWLYYNNKKTNKERELSLVLAHIYGYELEKEKKYNAKVKGWGANGNDGHAYYSGEFPLSLTTTTESVAHTKDEWKNYGVYEDNADFVLIEELEE